MNLSCNVRRRFVARAVAGAALLAAGACVSYAGIGNTNDTNYAAFHFLPFPDGRVVVSNGGEKGVRLFDWRTNQVRYIALPAGFNNLAWPSYSSDGSRVAVVAELPRKTGEQIVPESKLGIIDMATEQMISLQAP